MIPAIILAGGAASRLGGGDKLRQRAGGLAIFDRIVTALTPQCGRLILNANGDAARFADLRLPIVADRVVGRQGPLAGVLAGLDWVAEHEPAAAWVLTVPSDTPFIPRDLVRRLEDARTADDARLICAGSGGRRHYTIALWSVALRGPLRHALVAGGMRKAGAFFDAQAGREVEWATAPFDPFLNINTPHDRATADAIAARLADPNPANQDAAAPPCPHPTTSL